MTTIITRTIKGSAITNNEFDANLNNLNTYKIEDSDTRSSVRPTLIADFANTKKLPLNATFNRGSTGTYYDGKSVVKAEENLFVNSSTLATGFSGLGATLTANSAVAPDGTTTGVTLTETRTTTGSSVYQFFAPVAGLSYTYSIYAKANTTNYLQIADGSNFANFDLLNGIVGSKSAIASSSITAVGNGWYRCVWTRPSSNGLHFYLNVIGSATSAWRSLEPGSVYIWGAQLEQRSTVTAYTPTTSSAITNYIPVLQTAAVNTPRFDVDPVTGESKGLLIESSATNLLTYSDQFVNSVWVKSGSSIQENTNIAPDGTYSADSLIPGSTSNWQYCRQSTTVAAGQISCSVYAKSAGYRYLLLSQSGASYAAFDLNNGSTSSSNAVITSVGNGWYRCVYSPTVSAGTFTLEIYATPNTTISQFTGNGYSGVYIWGAQLEAGSFATSYIPTTASQVTRASDSLYTTDVSWLNPNEGTFLFNKKAMGTKANQTLFSLDNGTTDIESRVALVPNSRNLLTYTEQFDNAIWTKRGTATVTANATTAPDGTLTADLMSVGALNTNDIYQYGMYVNTGYLLSPSVYILKVSTTGTLRITSPAGSSYGQWLIDLSLIGSTWTRIYLGHPAVTVSNTFTSITGTTNGLQFSAVSGTLSFYVWGAQLELGSTASPYEPNPLYLSTFEVGSDGYALSDNNTWNDLAAYAYASNDISASQNNNPYASVNIQSSTAGTKAIINKTSGTVDFKNCNIKDMSMGGGATFTASKTNNSYDQGNNFGITFQ